MNDTYCVKRLSSTDDDSYTQYLHLLKQNFTIDPPAICQNKFNTIIENLRDETHQIYIIKDKRQLNIVGSATLLIEQKIIHDLGRVAHIEDVIIHNGYRGNKLGKMLIDTCTEHAKQQQCYKVILNCSTENIPFYEKCGFHEKETEMTMYF